MLIEGLPNALKRPLGEKSHPKAIVDSIEISSG
jgi:hypothetical protein